MRTFSLIATALTLALTTGCVSTANNNAVPVAVNTASANPQTLLRARLQPVSGLTTSLLADGQLKLSFPGITAFSHDGARLSDELQQHLFTVIESLNGINYQQLMVLGHTDSSGRLAYNKKLSQQRAEQVKSFMLQQGLAADTLAAEGRGPAEPIADNSTTEGKAANRRVELVISFDPALTAALAD